MPRSKRFRHVLVAVLIAVAMLGQGTWALAGTTGGLNGTVVASDTGAPIANASVTVSSPSQTATTTTDATGHFVFLSLTPDTYTVSSTKDGYQAASVTGVSVFADSQQTVQVAMHKTLKTIASVRSQAAGSLVKSGTTADVYSVSAATQDKVSALGGGGSLNSAYSAVASVPGAVMPLNQAGYFQTVHIRGGDYDQVGYEFDGVPVNRSFDNYPSGQLSSLGMSELQVYTGATPADSEGQGLAGYINQVIKTGTYPGFADAALGIGTPTFYHKASVEAGGASPNRLFSYYAGIGGYNQDFRYISNDNGAAYSNPYSGYGPVIVGLTPVNGCSDPTAIDYTECYANGIAGPGGFTLGSYNWLLPSSIADRDVVVNLHFGIPHKNDSGRDDVQLLWDSAMLLNGFYESVNDAGGNAVFSPNSDDPGPVTYYDGFSWTGPVGQALPANYSQDVQPYNFPDSPPHPAMTFNGGAALPVNPAQRDAVWNNQEIVKLQYQKNFGSSAYLRAYGYTYYSDWLQTGPVCSYLNYNCFVSPDYELSSHTRGASLQFADQIDTQNLITLQGNYTTASSVRDNNTQMFNAFGSRSLGAILVSSANPLSGYCYNAANTSAAVACNRSDASYLSWACMQSPNNPFCDTSTYTDPATVSGLTCGGAPCEYLVAENGLYATYNKVVPKFSSVSLTDQFRPSTRWLFNIGVRADRFEFDGQSTRPNDPARQFWFKAFNLDNCVNAQGFLTSIDTLGVAPGACPAGYTQANLVNQSAQVLSYTKVQPRVSGTYTASPNTVFRFSGGEYVEPPDTAYEQYNTLQENLAGFLGSNFYNFGFTTPGHEVRPPVSYNYDLSWEQRLNGTDWSFKLTPFYRKTRDQIQNFFLDQATGFISGLNVGRQTSEGIEFQVNKGDFSQNGLSGMLSLTYTHSYINYDTLSNGTTIVSQINNDIVNYNSYTSYCQSHTSDSRCAGGSQTGTGAPCYNADGTPNATCTAVGGVTPIANPYWNAPVQSLLNPTADYATYDIFPGGIGGSADSFAIPYAATMVLNYKHDRFAITPSFQFMAGNRYGSPESTPGIDPASGCAALAGSASSDPRYNYGAAGGAPYNAMTCPGTIPIPNQYTGVFDQPGAFVNPAQFLMNLQVSYDVSPKVTLIGTFANIVNRCFGGSKEAWTTTDSNVCSYGINNSAGIIQPVGNVYNPGATIQPFVKYPYERYLGPVNVDGNSIKTPFAFYLEARIKL